MWNKDGRVSQKFGKLCREDVINLQFKIVKPRRLKVAGNGAELLQYECIQNFGGDIFWQTYTQRTKKKVEG
jgi:hypothetical protein